MTESIPVVIVIFAGIVALGHIVTTGWEELLFYNADSLVLALVEDSIQRGEAFQWVFSSQIFLFPESIFFALSTLLTDNARVAFAVNACFNLVALYALLRIAAHLLAHRSRHRFVEITIALGATLLFVIFVLLEPVASPNTSGLATPFLFTTYYYGVMLGGLFMAVLLLWATRSFSEHRMERNRELRFAIAATVVTALIGFSNPLFVFEVLAPLGLALLILVFMDRARWRLFGLFVGSVGLGLLVVLGLRVLFSGLFGSSVSRYISLDQIPNSIRTLYHLLQELLSTPEGAFKLFLIGSVMLVNFALVIYALYAQSRPSLAVHISTAEVFVVVFVGVSAVSLVSGMIGTGSTTTRYLQPLFIFPLLTCVAIGVYVLRRLLLGVERVELRRNLARFAIGIAAVGSSLVIVLGLMNVGVVSTRLRADAYSQSKCLSEFIGDDDLNGVASFWIARPFQIYGDLSGRILQVNPDLTIYEWMVNLASYDQDEFSYVIYDSSGILTREGIVGNLGDPRSIIDCGGYEIYDYQGTRGENILSQIIQDSRLADLKDY